ncbi:hypothetical protein [Pseudoduganella lutea]|uniref:Peptidase M15A C-terminal domain-containing protein n=1 Tax=Pseudoduganella lutea TaxID=321985 RepID=A0A4P6KUG3_9BURK|nr:hypothetical protein [Pseudoduganella lutea]QBE62457.1 hypothetical protein EWM63_05230 [Pseudoduganella lutea]
MPAGAWICVLVGIVACAGPASPPPASPHLPSPHLPLPDNALIGAWSRDTAGCARPGMGEAADFHVAGHTVHEVALWISAHLDFDQLILENFVPGAASSGWVHCSFAKKNRGMQLTKFKGSRQYYAGIQLTVPVPAMH